MPKSLKQAKTHGTGTAHDFSVTARRVVEQAIGEKLDGPSRDDPSAGKKAAPVALGKLGGAKGGPVKAKALTPARRKSIALKAAHARWKR